MSSMKRDRYGRVVLKDMRDLALYHLDFALQMDWVSRHEFLRKRMTNITFLEVWKSTLAPDQWLLGQNTGKNAKLETIPLADGPIAPIASRSCGPERPFKQLKLTDSLRRGARYPNDVHANQG